MHFINYHNGGSFSRDLEGIGMAHEVTLALDNNKVALVR